ncbi:Ras family protein, partial [Opisthorchis viverrini]
NISVGDIIVQTQIWDVTGEEEYHSLPGTYFEGAHGALIVYDITKSETFENVTEWLSEIHRCTNNECLVLLTGNKCDLDQSRTVLAGLAEQFARSVQMFFIETSARHGDNVETAFKKLI